MTRESFEVQKRQRLERAVDVAYRRGLGAALRLLEDQPDDLGVPSSLHGILWAETARWWYQNSDQYSVMDELGLSEEEADQLVAMRFEDMPLRIKEFILKKYKETLPLWTGGPRGRGRRHHRESRTGRPMVGERQTKEVNDVWNLDEVDYLLKDRGVSYDSRKRKGGGPGRTPRWWDYLKGNVVVARFYEEQRRLVVYQHAGRTGGEEQG
jgi:hypothetical protein